MDFVLISYVVWGVFFLAAFIQLVYLWFVFGKFAFYKPTDRVSNDEDPVSIIIAARNESENLQQYLPPILEQDYPKFEVIVVNDCSWDDSQKVLEELQGQYKHLKVSQLIEQEKYPTGKKFALTIGIKAASYDKLLLTDADCMPAGNQWLRSMQSAFTPGKEIVLGYSAYNRHPGLLNRLIRFESLMTSLFCFSFALMRNAFMGVGRNLAYSKDVFFRHKGFASHQHILCGDDDLFVNEAARPGNVAIRVAPESFTFTEPKRDFTSYSHQKERHYFAGKYYKPKHKWQLGFFYASHLLFYVGLAAVCVMQPEGWMIATGVYGLRLLSQIIICHSAAKKLSNKGLVWLLPVLDLLYLLTSWYFGAKGLFKRRRKLVW